MKSKRVLLSVAVLVIAGLLVLSGCDTNGDDDDDGATALNFDQDFSIIEFDADGDGELESASNEDLNEAVDDGGGKISTYDPDGDGTPDKVDGKFVRVLAGRFEEDVVLTSDTIWYLDGSVFIGVNGDADSPIAVADKTELEIKKGTEVRGLVSSQNPGALVIDRGGKINAVGTKSEPVVFTSAAAEGSREPGDWGGLIINGFARVQGGTADGEGSTGEYGGGSSPVNDDSSGTLKYARVAFGGTLFSTDNELNGIAFQGVGSGTDVEYVQVHRNADDGVEFFGGSVQVKHIVLSGIQDDSLDHDDGWNGSAQYIMIQQWDDGDNGIEGDGDATPSGGTIGPVNAVLANFTIVSGDGNDYPFFFRRSAEPDVYNSLVYNTPLNFDDDSVRASINEDTGVEDGTDQAPGTIDFKGVAIDATAQNSDFSAGSNGNAKASDLLGTATWPSSPVYDAGAENFGFVAQPTSVDVGTAQSVPATDPAGNSLDDTDFIGAVDPAGTDWTTGWTAFPEN